LDIVDVGGHKLFVHHILIISLPAEFLNTVQNFNFLAQALNDLGIAQLQEVIVDHKIALPFVDFIEILNELHCKQNADIGRNRTFAGTENLNELIKTDSLLLEVEEQVGINLGRKWRQVKSFTVKGDQILKNLLVNL